MLNDECGIHHSSFLLILDSTRIRRMRRIFCRSCARRFITVSVLWTFS